MSAPNGFRRFLELSPPDRAVLRERARELGRPLTNPQGEGPSDVFELLELSSGGQTFGIPIEAVQGVSELTGIATAPRAPPLLRGFVSFRGEILFGLELSTLLHTGAAGFTDLRRMVVLSAGALRAVLLAEHVLTIRSAHASSFVRDRLVQHPFVLGVDPGLVTLLDPGALIAHAFSSISGSAV